jgi:tRNA wybutosine-synthesizing protein 3
MEYGKAFLDAKEKAVRSLEKACRDDRVDAGIQELLVVINNSEQFFTSSSCAGRVVLLEIPAIGDKQQARFLGRWHRVIALGDLLGAVEKADQGLLWLLAQSPILHIGADSSDAADCMIKTAVGCGFKNSGLKRSDRKFMVEVCSTERLDAPIGRDGTLFCSEEHLVLLVDIANAVLTRAQEKLQRFEAAVKQMFKYSENNHL